MLNTTIVAVGIDDSTAQHLITIGHALENPGPNAEVLFGRMVAAPADALILGNHTDLDGNLVERLRAHRIDTPAIRIANGPRDEDWSKACAQFLDCGGDDVIVGPPHPEEVAASIRAVCRRAHPEPDHIVRFGNSRLSLEVNVTKGCVTLNKKLLPITGAQKRVLFELATALRPMSCGELYEKLHGGKTKSNSIQVLVSRLRKQLGRKLLPVVRAGAVPWEADREKRGYMLLGRVR